MPNHLFRSMFWYFSLAAFVLAGCGMGNPSTAFAFQKGVIERGDLTAYINANGIIRPARSAQVAWKISGRIEQVLAASFATVQEGQQLAVLVESSVPTSILSARFDVVEAQQSLRSLEENHVTARQQAQLAVVDAKEAYEKALQRLNAVSGERRYVNQAYIDGARAELMMAETEVDKAQDAYDHLSGRSDDDPEKAIALKLLSQAKQARDRSLGNLNYLLGTPTAREVERASAELALAEARLADAQRAYERLKDGVPPEDIQAAQIRLQIAQATVDQTVLTAPFTGMVTSVQSQPGDLVQPGDVLLSIEDQSQMYVDANVSEVDINRLKPGQYVEVTLDAAWGRTYSGKVVEIGASGSSVQGVVNFPVRVELIDYDSSVKSGMTAALRVLVEQLTGVLLVPNQAVRVQDGQRVVFVDKGGPLPVSVPVTLGVSSEYFSQVLEGDVQVGDQIILNPDLLLNPAGGIGVQ